MSLVQDVRNGGQQGRRQFSWSCNLVWASEKHSKLKSDLLVLVQLYPRLGIYVAHFGTGQSWS